MGHTDGFLGGTRDILPGQLGTPSHDGGTTLPVNSRQQKGETPRTGEGRAERLAIGSGFKREQRRRDGEDTTHKRAYNGTEPEACRPCAGGRCRVDLGIYS